MPSTSKPGAVIFVKDLQRVAKFYEKLLSLSVIQVEGDHVVLESEAIQLVLHAIPAHIVESISISAPPEVREETPIKLFFPVASIDQARASAPMLGGQVGSVEREWEFSGIRACDGYDPEGNVFQLRQMCPDPFGKGAGQ